MDSLDSLYVALVVAAMELAAMWVAVYHHRTGRPFEGGPLIVYRAACILGVVSLLCILAATFIAVPDARGLLVVAALVALGFVLASKLRATSPRVGPLRAETQAAQPAPQPAPQQAQRRGGEIPDVPAWTVRQAPQVAPVGAGVRSARVRRIQGMGASYGD